MSCSAPAKAGFFREHSCYEEGDDKTKGNADNAAEYCKKFFRVHMALTVPSAGAE